MNSTLFLHRDWARQTTSPKDSAEYKELSESAQTVIEISTTKPKLARFLNSFLAPVLVFLYASLSLVNNSTRLASFVLSRLPSESGGNLALPCFVLAHPSKAAEFFSLSGLCLASGGLCVCVTIMVWCSLGKAYFAFLRFFASSNTGYFFKMN